MSRGHIFSSHRALAFARRPLLAPVVSRIVSQPQGASSARGQPTLTAEIAFRLMRCLEANDRPPRRASGQARPRTAFLRRRLRCGFFGILRREQHDPAAEIERHGIPAPDMDAVIPPGSLSSLSFEGSRFVFLPSCRHCRLCMKIASRGGTAFSLFPFRSPAQHGLSSLPDPYRSARRATRHVFFFELQGKKCGLPNFCACAPHGLSPARALRRCAALLLAQAQKSGSLRTFFRCSAPPCLAVTGGQRGRDWRSLTNRKGKRP